jgi:hypothetical protein
VEAVVVYHVHKNQKQANTGRRGFVAIFEHYLASGFSRSQALFSPRPVGEPVKTDATTQ